jgi:hypothetical protein
MFWDNWFRSSKKHTEVLMLNARDGSLEKIPIPTETDLHLESAKKKGITRHFDKEGRGWTEKGVGKMYYIAYSALVKTIRLEDAKPIIMGVGVYLEKILGKELYAKVTPEIKEKVENSEWGIMIDPIKPTDAELKGASNESRHTESDERMIDYFADKVHKAMKAKFEWMPILMGLFLGVIIGIALVSFKVIKLG